MFYQSFLGFFNVTYNGSGKRKTWLQTNLHYPIDDCSSNNSDCTTLNLVRYFHFFVMTLDVSLSEGLLGLNPIREINNNTPMLKLMGTNTLSNRICGF